MFVVRCLTVATAAWNEDPSARPSFDQIINYLDEAMIECALDNDMDAQGLWSNNFKGKEYASSASRGVE